MRTFPADAVVLLFILGNVCCYADKPNIFCTYGIFYFPFVHLCKQLSHYIIQIHLNTHNNNTHVLFHKLRFEVICTRKTCCQLVSSILFNLSVLFPKNALSIFKLCFIAQEVNSHTRKLQFCDCMFTCYISNKCIQVQLRNLWAHEFKWKCPKIGFNWHRKVTS